MLYIGTLYIHIYDVHIHVTHVNYSCVYKVIHDFKYNV